MVVLLAIVMAFALFAMTAGTAQAATIAVPGDQATIQAAIDAASSGDTINVAAGTYTEAVVVNKSVHLVGAGAGNSIIQAPGSLPVATDINSVIVTVVGSGVNAEINGFTIAGPGPSGCGSIKAGIYVRGNANANIHDNSIVDVRDSGATISGCQNGIGILIGRDADATIGTATITNNLVVMYQKGGIMVDGAGSNASITDNTVTGIGTTAITAQNGIQISRGAIATLTGNTITGNSFHLDGSIWDWGATGVLLYQSGAVTLAGGNNISGNDSALYILDPTGPVSAGAEIFGASTAPVDWGYYVVNWSPYALDLTQSTFEGKAPASATTAEVLSIKRLVWDGINTAGKGIASLKAGNQYVDFYGSIQRAIDAASPGDTINVAAGTYTENLTVNKSVTLSGAGATSTTIAGQIAVSADNVTIDGFTITNPSGKQGIYAQDHSNLTITNNIVTDIGSADATTGGTNFGIAVVSSAAAVDGITITGNQVNHIVGGVGKSADGIAIGWSTGIFDVTNVTIQNNTISYITSSTDPWISGGHGGMGAYGILINHARGNTGNTGQTVAPQILNNEISYLEGLWAHGVGLEGNTPNALVQGNNIHNLIDHKSPADPDAAAIMVEDNLSADTVAIHANSFVNVWLGVRNATPLTVNAERNWWGDTDPSDNVLNTGGGSIDYDPWIGKPATVTYVAPTGVIHTGSPTVTATAVAGGADLTSATAVLALASVDPSNGWVYNMYTFSCTITPEGAVSCPATGLPEGNYTATVTVIDNDHIIGTGTGSFSIVDDAAPVTTDNAPAGWQTSDVTVTLTCTDAVSGCASTSYSVDGGTVQTGNTVLINTDGTHSIVYHSVDNLGHIETDKTATVMLDKTAPTVTYTGPTGTVHGYVGSITASTSDATSGLLNATLSLNGGTATACTITGGLVDCPVTLANGTYAAVITVTDNAGNSGTAASSFTYAAHGQPALSLSVTRIYWATYADYTAHKLSVDYRLTDGATSPNAMGVNIVGSNNSNGVILVTAVPLSVGNIMAGGNAGFTLTYELPTGITAFTASIYATASDPCGDSYAYPGPYPGGGGGGA